jgi:hypothetical protein
MNFTRDTAPATQWPTLPQINMTKTQNRKKTVRKRNTFRDGIIVVTAGWTAEDCGSIPGISKKFYSVTGGPTSLLSNEYPRLLPQG